jgi:hypothetical protein
MESSNNFHKAFREHFNIEKKDDWYQLNEKELQFYKDKGCEIKRISCPAGSMVMWDSRTSHCGVESIKGRSQSNFRNVSYICVRRYSKRNIFFLNIRLHLWKFCLKCSILNNSLPKCIDGINNLSFLDTFLLTTFG